MPKYKLTKIKEIRSILSGGIECDLKSPLCRRQDDCDGSLDSEHILTIHQGIDGDMHIGIGDFGWLRFRSYNGGGVSLATHNALRILAEAVKMDNENSPDVELNKLYGNKN